MGISVYKLAGKDGKGAWFARRSVHEGLGFEKWKKGLEREFPETMKVQGGPGVGNIRGIGGERRVEHKVVDGVGKMEGELVALRIVIICLELIQRHSLSPIRSVSGTNNTKRLCHPLVNVGYCTDG